MKKGRPIEADERVPYEDRFLSRAALRLQMSRQARSCRTQGLTRSCRNSSFRCNCPHRCRHTYVPPRASQKRRHLKTGNHYPDPVHTAKVQGTGFEGTAKEVHITPTPDGKPKANDGHGEKGWVFSKFRPQE